MKYIIYRPNIPLYKYLAECISKISDFTILQPTKNKYPLNYYTKDYHIHTSLCLDKLTSKSTILLLFPLSDFIDIYKYFKKYTVYYYFIENICYLPDELLPKSVNYLVPSNFTRFVLEAVVENTKILPFPVDTDKVNFTKKEVYNNNLLKALIKENTYINHLFPEIYTFDYNIIENEKSNDIIVFTGIRDYMNENKIEYLPILEEIDGANKLYLCEWKNLSELRNHINITHYEVFQIIVNEKDNVELFMKDNYQFYTTFGYKYYQIKPDVLRKNIKMKEIKYFNSITKVEDPETVRSVIIDYHSLESLLL